MSNNSFSELAKVLGMTEEDLIEFDKLFDEETIGCDGCDSCNNCSDDEVDEEADWENGRPNWIDNKLWITYEESNILDALSSNYSHAELNELGKKAIFESVATYFNKLINTAIQDMALTPEEALILAKGLFPTISRAFCDDVDDVKKLQALVLENM